MATLKTDGMTDFLNILNSIGENTTKVARRCVYAGANVAHEAIEASVRKLPLDNHFIAGRDPLRVITKEDRDDLAGCLGYSKIESDGGSTSGSVSFSGYIRRTEAKYPNGVPAVLIARSIEKGTSVRDAHPFVRPTVNRIRKEAVPSAMQATLDESIEQIKQQEG